MNKRKQKQQLKIAVFSVFFAAAVIVLTVSAYVIAGQVAMETGYFSTLNWIVPMSGEYDSIGWSGEDGLTVEQGDYVYSIDEQGRTKLIGAWKDRDDESDDQWIELPGYDYAQHMGGGFLAGNAQVVGNGRNIWAILDESGNQMFDGSVFLDLGEFSNGLCYAVKIEGKAFDRLSSGMPYDKDYFKIKASDLTYGYIDEQGEYVIKFDEPPAYGNVFSDDTAIVYFADRADIIDDQGNVLTTVKLKENLDMDKIEDIKYMINDSFFRGGAAVIYDGLKKGVVDKNGEWLVEPVFDRIKCSGPENNLLIVTLRDKYGALKMERGE